MSKGHIKLYNISNEILKTLNLNKNRFYDFGNGFYCYKNLDIAKQFYFDLLTANAYVNEYILNINDLKVLDLTKEKNGIFKWLYLLLQNRAFAFTNEIMVEAKNYITNNFIVDKMQYDIIIAYQASNSYFSVVNQFLSNTISLEVLEKVLSYKKLNLQIVLLSKKALKNLQFKKSKIIDLKFNNSQKANDLKIIDYCNNLSKDYLLKPNQHYIKNII